MRPYLHGGWRQLLVAVAICAGFGLFSDRLGPDNNWDLRYYHLYAPWAYLHGRYGVDIGAAQLQGYFNPVADLLFYGLVASPLNERPRVVAFIMGALHGINAALVLAIARHVLRPDRPLERWALRAAAFGLGVTGACFVSLIGTTTNDLISASFVLAALLGLLRVAERTPPTRVSALYASSGAMAGIGLGLKLTAVVFMPGLGLLAGLAAWRQRSAVGAVAFGAAVVTAFLLMAGHHMLTLWSLFRNPVFPLFNNVFQSPYWEPWAGRDIQFVPRSFFQALAYPFYWMRTNTYVVTELPFRDWRPAMATIAVVACAAGALARTISTKRASAPPRQQTSGFGLLLLFVMCSSVLWLRMFAIYRYAVVVEMLTGVVITGALLKLMAGSRERIVAAVAVLLIALATTQHLDWGRGVHPSLGIRPAAYSGKYIDIHVPPLPDDSVVLLATDQPVSYFIPYANPKARYLGIENNFLTLSQSNLLTAEIERLLRSLGPKYIVSVGTFDAHRLEAILLHYGLRLGPAPCQLIQSNLEEAPLALCSASAV
jgi:hypothetical protein